MWQRTNEKYKWVKWLLFIRDNGKKYLCSGKMLLCLHSVHHTMMLVRFQFALVLHPMHCMYLLHKYDIFKPTCYDYQCWAAMTCKVWIFMRQYMCAVCNAVWHVAIFLGVYLFHKPPCWCVLSGGCSCWDCQFNMCWCEVSIIMHTFL